VKREIRLSHLAFACYVFRGLERGYRDAYSVFLEKTNHALDMHNDDHRKQLLIWLNKWGCRQFELDSHDKVSEKLRDWFEKYGGTLPSEQNKLIDLSNEEITDAARVYYTLEGLTIPCSKGEKTVGPTGASKILFALRRDVYPIWDGAMRKKYKDCSTYSEYMKQSREELQELNEESQRNGIELSKLPSRLDRGGESLLKLLDEYRWVFITQKLPPPSALDFEKWYKWARQTTQRKFKRDEVPLP